MERVSERQRDREADFDDEGESEGSEYDARYIQRQKKQRRPKTRKLDSNPLFWTVEDVFRYLRRTNDCKDIAYRVEQEVGSFIHLILLFKYFSFTWRLNIVLFIF